MLRSSGLTIFSTLIAGGLGAVFYFYLARTLGPVEFGLLTLAITILTLVTDVSELGVNNAVVRFYPQYLQKGRQRLFQLLSAGLRIKLLAGIVVGIVGVAASPLLAQLFAKPELTPLLRICMLGVLGLILFSFLTSTLQAGQRFRQWSMVMVGSNLLRLVLVAGVSFYLLIDTQLVMLIFVLAPVVVLLFAPKMIPVKSILTTKPTSGVVAQIFSYSKWVALFTLIAAVSARLDTFLVGALVSARELGYYGAANQLVTVIPQVVSALGVVAAPKFASFSSVEAMLSFFKKLQLLVIGLGVLMLLAIPISQPLIRLIYGVEYLSTTAPFVILLVAMVVFLISVPVHNVIFYYYGKPQLFVVLSALHLGLISTFGYYLILNYGIVGAALAVLVGMIINLILPMVWFLWRIRQ